MQTMGRRSVTQSPEGYNVTEVQVPYTPSNPEHVKTKPIDAGGGAAFDFSSPFNFSQAEVAQRTPSTAAVHSRVTTSVTDGMQSMQLSQQAATASWYPPSQRDHGHWPQGPPPQPYSGQYPGYPAGPPAQYAPHGAPQGLLGGELMGWLSKRGPDGVGQEWRLRFFKLTDGGVLCYGKDDKGPQSGRIVLDSRSIVRPLRSPGATLEGKIHAPKKPCAFEIYQGPGVRTWYLDAGTPEKLDLWVRRLNEVVAGMQAMIGGYAQGGWQQQPQSYGQH